MDGSLHLSKAASRFRPVKTKDESSVEAPPLNRVRLSVGPSSWGRCVSGY